MYPSLYSNNVIAFLYDFHLRNTNVHLRRKKLLYAANVESLLGEKLQTVEIDLISRYHCSPSTGEFLSTTLIKPFRSDECNLWTILTE